ncbi:MAG: FAD-dependent oxidoreductase [Chloroflexota bacterium]|nr:FAD-dependent oxidoreductase [Chloroflexota bacterium]
MTEVVVIGGGIVGSSAAYRLVRGGARVTLIERADRGQATAAGAGIIAPGTARLSNPEVYPLIAGAAEYYPHLLEQLAEDGETNARYATPGELVVATTEEEASRLPEIMQRAETRRAAGMPGIGDIAFLTGNEAQQRFPPLANTYGAIFISGSSRINGRLMRDALQRAAVKRGATMVRGSAQLRRDGGRIIGVEVDGRMVSADAYILAGGAWSREVVETLGISLPVYPQRGQILHLHLPETDTSGWPIVAGFHSHYLLTFPRHRVVAGATREDTAGYDVRVTAGGAQEVIGEALRVAPGLATATLVEIRVGLRPATPDGMPILGRIPEIANLYVATGNGPSGLQLGPYSAAVVADMVEGKPIPFDVSAFAMARFGPQGTASQS